MFTQIVGISAEVTKPSVGVGEKQWAMLTFSPHPENKSMPREAEHAQ
jgi:hypothetical protein